MPLALDYIQKEARKGNGNSPVTQARAAAHEASANKSGDAKRHTIAEGDPRFAEAQPGDGKDGARKMDVGKAPVTCGFINYFPRAMNAVALVSEYGARKYNDGAFKTAWQDVPNGFNRYDDAVGRHLTHAAVEPYDDESQIAHLAHLAWNAMAALELALKNGQVELRQGNQVSEGRPIRDTFKAVKL